MNSWQLPRIELPDRPKLLLIGCFGEHNTGDEALLQSSLRLLRERWPQASITVFSNQPERTSRQFQVKALSNITFLKMRSIVNLCRHGQMIPVLRAIGSCDCIIVAGGELLRSDFGLHSVLTIFDRILLGRLLAKPVAMIGVGCGGLDPGLGLSMIRLASRGVPIFTREEESAKTLACAGIGIPVALSEIAFQLPERHHGVALPTGPKIAIALRDPARTASCRNSGITRADFLAGVARLAEHVLTLGATPVFVPFSCSPWDDDRLCHLEVRNLMRNPAAAWTIEEELPPDRLKNLFSAMDMVVGMRLHACVFGLAHARPVLALSYDPKVRKQMRHFSCEDAVMPLSSISHSPELLERIWAVRDQWGDKVVARLEEDGTRFHQTFAKVFGARVPKDPEPRHLGLEFAAGLEDS